MGRYHEISKRFFVASCAPEGDIPIVYNRCVPDPDSISGETDGGSCLTTVADGSNVVLNYTLTNIKVAPSWRAVYKQTLLNVSFLKLIKANQS